MLEKFVVVLLTILISNGWYHGILPKPPLTVYVGLGVAFALLMLWRYLPHLIQTVLRAPFLSLLVLWIGLSIFWSFSVEFSQDRVLWVVATAIWGLYIGMRFSLEEQQTILIWVVIISLFFSLVAMPIIPDAMIHGADSVHEGNWRGIFFHKNQFGVFMALAFGQLLVLGRRWGWWRLPLMALLLFAVLQSGSATALLLSFLPLALAPILRLLRLRHELLTGLLLILIPIGVFASFFVLLNAEAILVALGRSPTLTGRTDLWEASLGLILQRPLTGWGVFGAFAPSSPVMGMLNWEAPYAHNHWIDMTLNYGLVGTALYLLTLVVGLVQALQYATTRKTIESRYPLLLLIQLNFAVMSMQDLTAMADMMWILFVAVIYGLALAQFPPEKMPFRRGIPRKNEDVEVASKGF